MSQWKKIVRPGESTEKKNSNPKPKTPSKKEQDEFPEKYLIDGDSRRNNTRKNLYKNLILKIFFMLIHLMRIVYKNLKMKFLI